MKLFLHTSTKVRIIGETGQFECPPARFAELEPDYVGLPVGATVRYWSPDSAYFEGGLDYDDHDCGMYCDRVTTYTLSPEIYVDVQLSKHELCAGDSDDSITFTATLQDAEGNIIPLDYAWHIRLTHEVEGDVDRVLMTFSQGICSEVYTFTSGLPLGTWRLDDEKFDLVDVQGVLYTVRLINPVEFVVYRTL